MIEENTSHIVDSRANVVLVSKSQRLTKGDKAEARKKQKEESKERDVTLTKANSELE